MSDLPEGESGVDQPAAAEAASDETVAGQSAEAEQLDGFAAADQVASAVPAKLAFVALIEIQVQANWFELENRTRRDYSKQLRELVSQYENVRFRWFDAEAWTGRFTDFAICEFDDLDSYNSLWGELRRHPFLSTPYASISRVVMGMELDLAALSAQADDSESPASDPDAPSIPATPEPNVKQQETISEASPGMEHQSSPAVTCANCGKPLKPAAKFCSRCGSKVG